MALFDDAALEALSNRGLLRRARKDLQSGIIPQAIEESEKELRLTVADAVVTFIDEGPRRAPCPCPAVDICRHILIACCWLSQTASASPPLDNEKSPAPSSVEAENLSTTAPASVP